MAPQTPQAWQSKLCELAKKQHGVVTRRQLLDLGFSEEAIKHRLATGRLHPVWRGVYALGRPQLGRDGMWMAAVLSCGSRAILSHESAAALWGIRDDERGQIEVSVPASSDPRRPGIVVHRRATIGSEDVTRRFGIPVTTIVCTLVDLAARLRGDPLEAAINEADKRDLVNPEALRSALDRFGGRRGAPALRRTLDKRTFTLTDSKLERRFLPLARKAGLPRPETGRRINGFKVDFYWPELGLVVETTDKSRIPGTVCTQPYMPGINPVTGPVAGLQAFYDDQTSTGPTTPSEPPLACYVFANCSLGSSSSCTETRFLRFHLLHARRERIVEATGYVDRRRVAHRRGRRLRSLAIGRLRAGKHVIKIVARGSDGVRRMSVRRVRGCEVGPAHTRRLRAA